MHIRLYKNGVWSVHCILPLVCHPSAGVQCPNKAKGDGLNTVWDFTIPIASSILLATETSDSKFTSLTEFYNNQH